VTVLGLGGVPGGVPVGVLGHGGVPEGVKEGDLGEQELEDVLTASEVRGDVVLERSRLVWTRVVVFKPRGTNLELSNLKGSKLLKIRPGLDAKLVMSEWADSTTYTPTTLLELMSRKVGR
jgi:hypothetical protein